MNCDSTVHLFWQSVGKKEAGTILEEVKCRSSHPWVWWSLSLEWIHATFLTAHSVEPLFQMDLSSSDGQVGVRVSGRGLWARAASSLFGNGGGVAVKTGQDTLDTHTLAQ